MKDKHELEGRAPAYFEGWQRAFGVQGALPQEFEGKAQLGVSLADLSNPEYLFLRRTLQFSTGGILAAGASNGAAELNNPPGSGIIAVVTAQLINSSAGQTGCGWQMVPSPAVLAAINGWNVDSRQPPAGAFQGFPVCTPGSGTAVAIAPLQRVSLPAGGVYTIPPMILVPGVKVQLASITIATAFSFAFFWTERKQLAFER